MPTFDRDTEFVEFVTAQRAALVRMARLLTAVAAGELPADDHLSPVVLA